MSKQLVTLTNRCITQIRTKINKKALRIAVDSGGCNGFSYNYNFTNNIEVDDILITQGNAKVVIDTISAEFLKDATIDYTDEMIRSGFTIINPNTATTCGCNNSFSLKD